MIIEQGMQIFIPLTLLTLFYNYFIFFYFRYK